jgi:hypothetical protein
MGNKWDEMRAAFMEAEETVRSADAIINAMARMLCGRLGKVSPGYLKSIKRELKDFNIQTGRWK